MNEHDQMPPKISMRQLLVQAIEAFHCRMDMWPELAIEHQALDQILLSMFYYPNAAISSV